MQVTIEFLGPSCIVKQLYAIRKIAEVHMNKRHLQLRASRCSFLQSG
jgi:hypothetical protein